jgi:transcriptional regulator with XRE-family HTH domain
MGEGRRAGQEDPGALLDIDDLAVSQATLQSNHAQHRYYEARFGHPRCSAGVPGKVADMNGRAVVGYIHDQMSLSQLHFTYADLERLAGIREQRLSQWKRGTQPSYSDVQKLGRALAEHYPTAHVGAYRLLEVAGYAPEPDPSMIAFVEDARTWDALTVEFRQAPRWERLKAIQALEDILGKKS